MSDAQIQMQRIALVALERDCEHCGTPLAKRDSEKPSHFARRRFCNRECSRFGLKKRHVPMYVVEDRGHDTACWIWQRCLNDAGYGELRRYGKHWLAHRFFYVEANGDIPGGLPLDHLCRVTACVNPDHLEPVTVKVNNRRSRTTKLVPAEVREIRASTSSVTTLALRFGVSKGCVQAVRDGRSWRDITLGLPDDPPVPSEQDRAGSPSGSHAGSPEHPSLFDEVAA